MQVGFKRRGALAKAPAVDLQVLNDALNVVAGLSEGNALNPIDRVDLGIARITVLCHPLLNSPAARIITRKGQNEGAAIVLEQCGDFSSAHQAVIAGLGKLAAHYNDAQAMLLIGKTALARGLPMDVYAFPDVGVPNYSPIGPQVDRCIVYAIVRTESGFDQRDMSSAKAVGLMQVTPAHPEPLGSVTPGQPRRRLGSMRLPRCSRVLSGGTVTRMSSRSLNDIRTLIGRPRRRARQIPGLESTGSGFMA
jgi:hypothetical protein